MKKKLIMSIASLTLALSMSVQVFANPLVVNLNGVNRVFTNATEENGVVVVNGEELAEKLNIEFEYNHYTGAVKFSNKTTTLILQANSNLGTLNDKPIELPAMVTVVDVVEGTVTVPLEFVTETFGSTVTTKNDEIVTDFNNPFYTDLTGVKEITDETKVYNFNQAVKVAMENNSNTKLLDLQFDATKDAILAIDDAIAAGQGYYIANPNVPVDTEAYYDLLDKKYDLTVSLDTTGEQKEFVKTSIEINLLTSLNSLDTAKVNYYLTQENLELQQQDLDITKVKHNLGLASNYSLQKAESTLENTKTTLNTLETQIISSEQTINSILGLPLDSDVYIENTIKVIEPNYTLDTVVRNAKADSLTVQNAEDELDDAIQKYGSSSIQYDIAVVNLEQARKDVEKAVYSDFNSLKSLVSNDKMLNNNRDIAVADYNMALEQYKAGYITKYTLDQMLLNIASKDAEILKNKMNYQALTFKIDNPSLYIIAKS